MVEVKQSRGKPTKKAGSRSRSTTSTTTAAAKRKKAARKKKKSAGRSPGQTVTHRPRRAAEDAAAAHEVQAGPALDTAARLGRSNDPAEPLSPATQDAVLDLLLRGASPAAACMQLGQPVFALLNSVRGDAAFAERTGDVTALLSGNVMAMLYRGAMEGNVSAQTSWLKLFPPASWQQPQQTRVEPVSIDETLSELSDAELKELAFALGMELPGTNAATLVTATDPQAAGTVSADPAATRGQSAAAG